jgi:nucleoside-diphosphate-sugar epimerase
MNAGQLSLSREDLDHVLEHTRGVWEELRGQRIFITGGTGFFGMWLLESFVWANRCLDLQAEATILTRDPAKFAEKAPHLADQPELRFHRGDIRDFAFPEGGYSHLIHAATPVSPDLNRDEPLTMFDILVGGARRVLDFAAACGAKKFLLTSSGAVYGRQPPELTHVPEEYAGAPETNDADATYGEGKRLAELLCMVYSRQYGIEAKIARCFAFVGPYLPVERQYAAGNFIRDALAGGPIRVQSDGTPRRSYLYAADLAIWLWTILFRGTSCRPYNVGSDEDLSIRDLAQRVAASVGCEVRVATPSEPGRLLQRYVPQIARARQELDLAVWTALPVAIQRTADFVRGQCRAGARFCPTAGIACAASNTSTRAIERGI